MVRSNIMVIEAFVASDKNGTVMVRDKVRDSSSKTCNLGVYFLLPDSVFHNFHPPRSVLKFSFYKWIKLFSRSELPWLPLEKQSWKSQTQGSRDDWAVKCPWCTCLTWVRILVPTSKLGVIKNMATPALTVVSPKTEELPGLVSCQPTLMSLRSSKKQCLKNKQTSMKQRGQCYRKELAQTHRWVCIHHTNTHLHTQTYTKTHKRLNIFLCIQLSEQSIQPLAITARVYT